MTTAAATKQKWENYRTRFPEIFWSRVDKSNGPDKCWPWQGRKQTSGYGRITVRGIIRNAHRVAYELEHGVHYATIRKIVTGKRWTALRARQGGG